MRITQNILISNFLRNLNSISRKVERTEQQLATGLKYSRPSQAPIEVGRIMGYQTTLARLEQYIKNIDDGISQVENIDTILQAVNTDIGRSRDLALTGANDDLNQADRNAIGQEIDLIIESTLANANSRFRNRYAFSGWRTTTTPFEAVYNQRTNQIEDVLYTGNKGEIQRLVGDLDQLAVNIPGNEIFLDQTYTLYGRVLPSDTPLGFSGTIYINDTPFKISEDLTLNDIALMINAESDQTHVFALVENSSLVLESASAVNDFTLSDNRNNELIEDLGLRLTGAYIRGAASPTLPIIDSTPAIFDGAGAVANLTYDNTNNVMNIFLGADANDGISKAANIIITPGTYASVADLITEIQTRIDEEYGAGVIKVSDGGGGTLRIETVATGDEIDPGDLVIGGPFNGLEDTASDMADLNLIAVAGNAPATFAGTAGTDGNDKIIIDLGPSADKFGKDQPPQIIDLRASVITDVNDLVNEINYQIFQNDILRGSITASLDNGRIRLETLNKGDKVLASDFTVTEGATGTLEALGISDTPTPGIHTAVPIVWPIIVVAGLNDTITIDLGPSTSLDGTNPPPIDLNIPAGIYNNCASMFNQIVAQIQANPVLNGAVTAKMEGPVGNEHLVLETINKGSAVRGEDFIISGALTNTLGFATGSAEHGGGVSDGQCHETQPSNIFKTLMTIRDDCNGVAGLFTSLVTTQDENGNLIGLIEGDEITVSYDAGDFTFKVLSGDTMETFIRTLNEIFKDRAEAKLLSDGTIEIDNRETHQIADLKISAKSASGEDRTKFNEIFSDMPSVIPGLGSLASKSIYDPVRYRRLGEEDLILADNDSETVLKNISIVGARSNRLSTISNLLTSDNLNVKELKNSIEAADYSVVITTLSQLELIFQSALNVGSKVLPPSLFDFLT